MPLLVRGPNDAEAPTAAAAAPSAFRSSTYWEEQEKLEIGATTTQEAVPSQAEEEVSVTNLLQRNYRNPGKGTFKVSAGSRDDATVAEEVSTEVPGHDDNDDREKHTEGKLRVAVGSHSHATVEQHQKFGLSKCTTNPSNSNSSIPEGTNHSTCVPPELMEAAAELEMSFPSPMPDESNKSETNVATSTQPGAYSAAGISSAQTGLTHNPSLFHGGANILGRENVHGEDPMPEEGSIYFNNSPLSSNDDGPHPFEDGNAANDCDGLVVANPLSERFQEVHDVEEQAVAMNECAKTRQQQQTKNHRTNRLLALGLGCGLLVLLGTVVVVVIVLTRQQQYDGVAADENSNIAQDCCNTTFVPTLILDLPEYTVETIQKDTNRTTPQYRAYQWLTNDPWLHNYSEEQLLQRFALATFYFATKGEEWTVQGGNITHNLPPKGAAGGKPSSDSPRPGQQQPTPELQKQKVPSAATTATMAYWLDYDSHECDWFSNTRDGSTCLERGDFNTSLSLIGNNLHGTIPPQIGLLSNSLREMFLPSNGLSGSLPVELFQQLTLLEDIEMTFNRLTGTIPADIGTLTAMTVLRLKSNQLQGTLPWEVMTQMIQLWGLSMDDNQLTGSIPDDGDCLPPNLTRLNLGDNLFYGSIPSSLPQHLPQLRTLLLHRNLLTGTLPSNWDF